MLEKDIEDTVRDAELRDVEEEISAVLLSKQRSTFEKELSDFHDRKKKRGNTAAVFSVKEKVIGAKKGPLKLYLSLILKLGRK